MSGPVIVELDEDEILHIFRNSQQNRLLAESLAERVASLVFGLAANIPGEQFAKIENLVDQIRREIRANATDNLTWFTADKMDLAGWKIEHGGTGQKIVRKLSPVEPDNA